MSAAAEQDDRLMRRALQLARRGRGDVEPNPMVGCVIAGDQGIIAEGHHAVFGGPHAEAAALAKCAGSARGATAYVTLEPCCHTDKKTPPCVPLLIEANLKRVVVACEDPNPRVAGSGIAQLRAAGIPVDVGIGQAEARQLNAAFFAGQLYRRPYVTLKWAQTADGKVAGPGGKRRTISNAASFQAIHQLRSRCDAILIGIDTALNDDPILTARPPGRVLTRVVLDKEGRLPRDCRLLQTIHEAPLLVYSRENAAVDETGHLSLSQILGDLFARGVTHLLVEPGPRLAQAFLKQNLADRVWVFRSANRIGDDTAPAAAPVSFAPTATIDLEGDLLTEHLNPHSDVFFAPAMSADFPRTDQSPASGLA